MADCINLSEKNQTEIHSIDNSQETFPAIQKNILYSFAISIRRCKSAPPSLPTISSAITSTLSPSNIDVNTLSTIKSAIDPIVGITSIGDMENMPLVVHTFPKTSNSEAISGAEKFSIWDDPTFFIKFFNTGVAQIKGKFFYSESKFPNRLKKLVIGKAPLP